MDNPKINLKVLTSPAAGAAIVDKNHVTEKGRLRCRFDMMIRFPETAIRVMSNPFTERGDRFEKDDPRKMLKYLVSYFIKKHGPGSWVRAELYDNSLPAADKRRIILKYEKGVVEQNYLADYAAMFDELHFKLPDWLL